MSSSLSRPLSCVAEDMPEEGGTDAAAAPTESSQAPSGGASSSGVRMSFEEYRSIANVLVLQLRRVEGRSGGEF